MDLVGVVFLFSTIYFKKELLLLSSQALRSDKTLLNICALLFKIGAYLSF
jgi:hypothetical protein